jgi:hypothetical protein
VLLDPIQDLVSVEKHAAFNLEVRDTPAMHQEPDGRFSRRQHVRDLHGIQELSGNTYAVHR